MVAFGGTAQDFTAGLVTVPFLADPLIRASANVMQLNDDWNVNYSYCGGIALTRLRLNSANSRIRGYPNLTPFQAVALGGSRPIVNDIRLNPIRLFRGENVTLQATNTAANATIALLSLVDPNGQYENPPPGARRVRFTAAPTSVANAWSGAYNVTLDDDLEAGVYDVWGFVVAEATTYAARLIFKDQVERPGTIGTQLLTDQPWPVLYGGMGKLGSFESITPPFIDVLCNAAAAIAVVGYMLISKAR